ncbi:hypothetical protein K443DRAFT_13909 [Laccaria amethystina LaAM-08-1]|uniref:Uncharacterized protein n=1 Tax=Laccaria amethystina LaAM-08-1 TaxID=1095629 RepID=A0A0C9WHZ5_9AGAR|nr:hypothetical protein K443DRAFT_13909 [Laccaria amethystina LaAM-08-1]
MAYSSLRPPSTPPAATLPPDGYKRANEWRTWDSKRGTARMPRTMALPGEDIKREQTEPMPCIWHGRWGIRNASTRPGTKVQTRGDSWHGCCGMYQLNDANEAPRTQVNKRGSAPMSRTSHGSPTHIPHTG